MNIVFGCDKGYLPHLAVAIRSLIVHHDTPLTIYLLHTEIDDADWANLVLLLLDAHQNGGPPGQLRLLQPVLPDLSELDAHALRDYFADTHYATPIRALTLLEHLGRLPPRVAVLGCEPAAHEELAMGLTAPVAAAIERAVPMVLQWIESQADARVHVENVVGE